MIPRVDASDGCFPFSHELTVCSETPRRSARSAARRPAVFRTNLSSAPLSKAFSASHRSQRGRHALAAVARRHSCYVARNPPEAECPDV